MENSPNSVSEALVVGTPVIAAHAGGVLSMLEHNRSGWTFQEGDFTMLSGLIIGLMETPDIILRVSSEGRRIARERHNPDRIVKKLTDNYAHILGKSDKST
jgi:glycosyltransferase involved in cell wall biosynthesis